MNFTFHTFLVFFAFISLVGGINWLFTAINNWTLSAETHDLLTEQLNVNQHVANIIYIVVFLCTLALFLMVTFPQNLKAAYSHIQM